MNNKFTESVISELNKHDDELFRAVIVVLNRLNNRGLVGQAEKNILAGKAFQHAGEIQAVDGKMKILAVALRKGKST